MSEQKKKYNTTLLDVRLVEVTDKATGKKKKTPKLQLAKGVELTLNGVKVDLGQYNSAFLKQKSELEADIDFLLQNEYIKEEKAEEDKAYLAEKNIQLALKMKV